MSERDRCGFSAEGDLLHEQNGQPQALEGEGDWYQFRVKGHLLPCWSEWLGGLAIANLEDGECLLTGQVVDQAALHGLLVKVRDLNLPLISVCRIEPAAGDAEKALLDSNGGP